MAIEVGGTLPDIDLATTIDGRVNLRDFAGKPLAVYFYPKDDTAGCTREARDFSELQPEFHASGCALLGISRDTPARHRKFIDKHELTISLATDDTGAAGAAFGTWVEKQLYGRKYMGLDRSSFLFDAAGVLRRAWRKVRVPGHALAVLQAVRDL